MLPSDIFGHGAEIRQSDVDAMWRILSSVESSNASPEQLPASVHASGISQEVLRLARKIKQTRDQRAATLPQELLGEPGWDIMLAAFIAEGAGYRVKIGDLCYESGVATTTALRWVNILIKKGMLEREAHPTDARINYVRATTMLVERMNECLLGAYTNQTGLR